MGVKRLQIVLTFVVLIGLGIPVWWKTTEVYRAHIPVEDVHAWEKGEKWHLFADLFAEYPMNAHENAVKAAPGYKLSFTIANADPLRTYIPKWNFTSIQQTYLQEVLDKLSPVADFTVESQIFHFAGLSDRPLRFDAKAKTYVIPDSDISLYINPDDWKLDFSTNNLPTLSFIVYIPSKTQSPINIRFKNGTYASTNAYMIPQWGGISIYNPAPSPSPSPSSIPNEDGQQSNKAHSLWLGCAELGDVMRVFRSQLLSLFGSDEEALVSEGKYQQLIKHRMSINLQYAIHSLSTLSRLIASQGNMMVLDNIATTVQRAVDELQEAHDHFQEGDLLKAMTSSKEAIRYADMAFFDPTILSLLYFPDEHKYAIYVPLFLPVLFPVLAGLVQEHKHRKQKKRQLAEAKQKKKE